jgi:hypothetical protein
VVEAEHTAPPLAALPRPHRGRIGLDGRGIPEVRSPVRSSIFEAEAGTPQGGIRSPLLANIALSVIEERYERWAWPRHKPTFVSNPATVHKRAQDNRRKDLVERAVAKHTDLPWVRLYIARWLRAPMRRPDGTDEQRTKGTPQGGAISPLLANLFLHYAFDVWMRRNFPVVQFERYADDAIVHCSSEWHARQVLEAIRDRFKQCGLEIHPTKTRIVYCKDDDRPGRGEHISFDFLGYTFQPRRAKKRRGKFFVSFLPAILVEPPRSGLVQPGWGLSLRWRCGRATRRSIALPMHAPRLSADIQKSTRVVSSLGNRGNIRRAAKAPEKANVSAQLALFTE